MPTLRVARPIAERSRLSESWVARSVYLSAAGVATAGAAAGGTAAGGTAAAAVMAVSIRVVARALDQVVSKRGGLQLAGGSLARAVPRSYRDPGRGAHGPRGLQSSRW